MADGQLKLFKGDKSTFNSINGSNEKKISEGNLIVAKENSSSGDLYIDYSNTERLKLASGDAIVGVTYEKSDDNDDYVLKLVKLNGSTSQPLQVDESLNNSHNPVKNKTVYGVVQQLEGAIGEHSGQLNALNENVEGISNNLGRIANDVNTIDGRSYQNSQDIANLRNGDSGSIRDIAGDEINTLIKAADPANGVTISNINTLVRYVDENAGDIAELIAQVGEKATCQEISRAAYDNLSIEDKYNGTIYLIYDENGFLDSNVDIVALQNRVASLEGRMPTTAAGLAYSNVTTGMTAATVQAAIDELNTRITVALGDVEALLSGI